MVETTSVASRALERLPGDHGQSPHQAILPPPIFVMASTDGRGGISGLSELKQYIAKQGCTFDTHKGGSGHITVRRGNRVTQLPMHGSHKELGIKVIKKILKDLGLK